MGPTNDETTPAPPTKSVEIDMVSALLKHSWKWGGGEGHKRSDKAGKVTPCLDPNLALPKNMRCHEEVPIPVPKQFF